MAARDNALLLSRVRKGDEDAKKRMVEANLRLVEKIASRFTGRGCDREDIVQVGAIGLIKAVDRFDTGMGTCFSTYAYPMIEGEIKRFLRDNGSMKVSRSLKETAAAARRGEESLRRSLGREPLMSEIADETGISAEEITEALTAMTPVRSIYERISDAGGAEMTLGDTIADAPEEDGIIDRIAAEQILAALPPRERRIIELRYFEERPQREIAEEIGVSQVQVSRLERKILGRLRQLAEGR